MKNNTTIGTVLFILFLILSISPVRSQCNYFTKIATSSTDFSRHTLGIKNDGTLWAWGVNTYGQLGDGTTTQRNAATQIGARTDWVDIAVGREHSVGITANGRLWAWGRNIDGSLGDFTNTQRNSPIQVGTATNWVSISAGYQCTLGITADGKLWGWGRNAAGQLGNSTTTNIYFPEQIGTATNWVSVKTSNFTSFAIDADGKLWSWGSNNYGVLGSGNLTSRIVPAQVGTATNWASISVGLFHSSGITTDGKLWTWGLNSGGQLGDGTTVDKLVPTQVGTATNWAIVSTGRYFASAISNEGRFWAWGYNASCQMANPDAQYALTPRELFGGNDWEFANAAQDTFYNIKSDASNVAWGLPFFGQLGDGLAGTGFRCSQIIIGNTPVFTGLATSGSAATMYQNNYNMYNASCALIAAVSQRVASLHPIKGNTTAKVWVETTQPPLYVKRHYEIMPTTNANTAKGKITLYFTQAEFDDFNAVNTATLPTSSNDNTGKASLIIERLSGSSSDGSGLPTTYAGTSEIINPIDSDIVWNTTQNRWEISFVTTGFGGFFIKADAALSTNDNQMEDFSYYPNPTTHLLHFKNASKISEIAVYNLLGQKVLYKNSTSNEVQINLSNLANQTYLIKIKTEDKTKTIKVVKE